MISLLTLVTSLAQLYTIQCFQCSEDVCFHERKVKIFYFAPFTFINTVHFLLIWTKHLGKCMILEVHFSLYPYLTPHRTTPHIHFHTYLHPHTPMSISWSILYLKSNCLWSALFTVWQRKLKLWRLQRNSTIFRIQ